MNIPCDGCLCRVCAEKNCICGRCVELYRRVHRTLAVATCNSFVHHSDEGGATSDGTLQQPDATTGDA